MSDWLKNLKAGDDVIIASYGSKKLATVEKVTKLHVIVNGRKFRMSNGMSVGSGWGDSLKLCTPENREAAICLAAKEALRRIVAYKLEQVTTDALVAAVEALEKGGAA